MNLVLQLANVPGPRILLEHAQSLWPHASCLSPFLSFQATKRQFNQGYDIRRTMSQRRNMNRKSRKSEQQIFAKPPCPYLRKETPIRRCYDSGANTMRSICPNGLDLPVLEYTKELRLHR